VFLGTICVNPALFNNFFSSVSDLLPYSHSKHSTALPCSHHMDYFNNVFTIFHYIIWCCCLWRDQKALEFHQNIS